MESGVITELTEKSQQSNILKKFLEEIRVEQTLFSLPFIFVGALIASEYRLNLRIVILIIVAAAFARATGMLLNRLIDISIDRLNPRTRNRHIASGSLSLTTAIALTALSLSIYLFAAYMIGPVPLKLSWIPLVMFVFYPYTKRFTWLCHIFLGLTLGLAPLAGWLAVSPQINATAWLLYFGVSLWVAGFDIYYATLDIDFDRRSGIFSIPARFGIKNSFLISIVFHILAIILIFIAGLTSEVSLIWFNFWALSSIYLLVNDFYYSRKLATPEINTYLQRNSYFSVIIFTGTLLEAFFRR